MYYNRKISYYISPDEIADALNDQTNGEYVDQRDEQYTHVTQLSRDDIVPELYASCEEWAVDEYNSIADEMHGYGYRFSDDQRDKIITRLVIAADHYFVEN